MATKYVDSFGARKPLKVGDESYDVFRLDVLEKAGIGAFLASRSKCCSKICSGRKTIIT